MVEPLPDRGGEQTLSVGFLEELLRDRRLLGTFLETTQDQVYFKDRESRFIRISDSQARWLGVDHPSDAVGKTDADFFDEEHARQALKDEQKILRTGKPLVDAEEKETHDGIESWVSTRKMPLIGEGGQIIGTFGISRDISERKRAEEALRLQSELNEHQSLHDALTGLPNRRLFRDRIEQALLGRDRDGGRVAILLLDLDRFKEINDTLGHHNGDEFLRQIGERLRQTLRGSDTVARLGGDEFGMVIRKVTDSTAIIPLLEKLSRAIELPVTIEGLPIGVEGSIGVAFSPDDAQDADTLLQRADVAMYVAKAEGRLWTFYDAERDKYDPIRLTLVGELRRAIDEKELVLHYQPKADVRTGVIESVEALVRWEHPERGLIQPNDFIPQAQETGLMKPLTRYVIDLALEQCRAWKEEGLDLAISVNVSTRNLLDFDFPTEVAELLAKWELPPNRLKLEITEGTMLEDPFRTKVVLDRLHELGVGLAIDDFGTGYSSLAYLKSLPVDELKIDRSFVLGMNESADDEIIVRSTIDLGQNLGFEVVAEGVENERLWTLLEEMGCDLVQGYHLARPLPPDALAEWLGARAVSVCDQTG